MYSKKYNHIKLAKKEHSNIKNIMAIFLFNICSYLYSPFLQRTINKNGSNINKLKKIAYLFFLQIFEVISKNAPSFSCFFVDIFKNIDVINIVTKNINNPATILLNTPKNIGLNNHPYKMIII